MRIWILSVMDAQTAEPVEIFRAPFTRFWAWRIRQLEAHLEARGVPARLDAGRGEVSEAWKRSR